jgi:hypothetical protein
MWFSCFETYLFAVKLGLAVTRLERHPRNCITLKVSLGSVVSLILTNRKDDYQVLRLKALMNCSQVALICVEDF